METRKYSKLLSYFTVLTYLIMIAINALANILPINDRMTGEISDSYFNLFAPAAFTFAIWGLIYFLLFLYVIYQLVFIAKMRPQHQELFNNVNLYFSISSLINAFWILAWHYDIIWLSLVLMMGILACLVIINSKLRYEEMDLKENILSKLPFSVYFGWITVATIANTTTFLVASGWDGSPISPVVWTVIILIVGAVIGFLSILYYRALGYGAVLIWAYSGILAKHLMESQFNREYPAIIIAVAVSLVIIVLGNGYLFKLRINERKKY